MSEDQTDDQLLIDDTTKAEIKKRHTQYASEARAQAAEGKWGFLASEFVTAPLTGEVFEVPNKNLFDNDQQERWDILQDELQNEYEREEDITNSDGEMILRGKVKYPHRMNGKRLPPWTERLAVVLWGEDGAKRAKEGGLMFKQIEMIWAKQDDAMIARGDEDPK